MNKRKSIFDVPLDSDEGKTISAISQMFAQEIIKEWPETYNKEDIPDLMLQIKKYWDKGILEFIYDPENDGIYLKTNAMAAINYLTKGE